MIAEGGFVHVVFALIKRTAIETYASYSEFVRRTALIEAAKIIKNNENEGAKADECN